MKLINIFEQILVENILDIFIEKNVGDDKSISNEIFEEIKKASKGKVNYILWLSKAYMNNVLHFTDIYKFGDDDITKGYFTIFEMNKDKYPYKDINQYKTEDDISNFINKSIDIREKDIDLSKSTEQSDNYVSIKDIKRLNDVGIKYFGIFDGYQIFYIPNEAKDNDQAFKRYNEILGKCAGRKKGAIIDICTFKENYFKNYLTKHPGSSYFLLYNLSDPESPYQIHKESAQFKDRKNKNVPFDYNIELFHFIEKKMGYEEDIFMKEIYRLKPVTENMKKKYGSDTINGTVVNGVLNGSWIEFGDTALAFNQTDVLTTYKDGKRDGVSKVYNAENGRILEIKYYINGKNNGINKTFWSNGNVFQEITYKDNHWDGVFKEYDNNGRLKLEEFYVDDERVSKKEYYDNGQLEMEVSYENGVYRGYYEDGALYIDGHNKNGKKDNDWKEYDENGRLIKHEIYDNGELIKKII